MATESLAVVLLGGRDAVLLRVPPEAAGNAVALDALLGRVAADAATHGLVLKDASYRDVLHLPESLLADHGVSVLPGRPAVLFRNEDDPVREPEAPDPYICPACGERIDPYRIPDGRDGEPDGRGWLVTELECPTCDAGLLALHDGGTGAFDHLEEEG